MDTDFSSVPIKTSFTFTAREYEPELNLYYYRARYYDPSVGRFLQQDPDPGKVMNPITVVNKYTYVGNNPISISDPSGMSWLSNFWDHNNEWTRDIAVTIATIAVLA